MEARIVAEGYESCLHELEANGFEKHSDNGVSGLNGNVFTSTYTKNQFVTTVIHMAKTNTTYVVTEEKAPISKRLVYREEYAKENIPGRQTKLHVLEQYRPGSSFVIQLKNNHFIVCDGGYLEELPSLLAYLESLVPRGEKPVIEAWLLTHPHHDHVELFRTFMSEPSHAERIYVEGIYVDIYDEAFAEKMGITNLFEGIRCAASMLKTADGSKTQIYRPHAGQRYYFSDITVDVMQTMVQMPREKWHGWRKNLNEMSAWYMFTIEGQKFLNSGDADLGSMRTIMENFDKEYLKMELMAVQHHGVNVYKEFSDYIQVKTVIYPYRGMFGPFKEGQDWPGSWQASFYRNEYLHTTVEEKMSYGDGTKILTFPYEVGTAVSLEPRNDIYEFVGAEREKRIIYERGGVVDA